MIVFVFGLGIGYGIRSAPSSPTSISFSMSHFGKGTRADWWQKLEANHFKMGNLRGVEAQDKAKFLEAMGQPDTQQILGDKVYWTYKCSDGLIQLVISQNVLDGYGMVIADQINEF
jgi:hypothetical protein